jgi:hypothetical protein
MNPEDSGQISDVHAEGEGSMWERNKGLHEI